MARKDITLSPDELAAFLDEPHTLQVATIDADGYPHLAPMWYVVDDGKIVFRSFSKSQKIVNLMRNPKISVLVESGKAYKDLKGAMIRGNATLIDDAAYILELYGRLSARYPMVGDTPIKAAFGRYASKNTAVRIEPVKIATWDHSKLGGAY